MELGEPDSSGRRRPEPVEDSEFEIEIFAQVQCIQSEDHREGVRAFKEKRVPVYRGR